ncbi:MAG TPA: hypothetical protein VF664_19555 [Cystobacter sp.]
MKNWILCLALAVSGCAGGGSGGGGNADAGGGGGGGGGNNNAYTGTWKGDVSGWSITLVVKDATEAGGSYYITGTSSTNKASCFSTGDLSGTITPNAGATLIAQSDNGDTTINIQGPVANGKITAKVEAQGETADCTFQSTSATFTRQ